MASDMYLRYMPPKNNKATHQAAAIHKLPASKAAVSPPQNTQLQPTSLQQSSPPESSFLPTPPYFSRTPKRKHEKDDGLLEDEPRSKRGKGKDDLSRHRSLLSKREKSSTKNAEKLNSAAVTMDLEEIKPEVHPLQPLPQPEPVRESTTTQTFSALPPWVVSPIRVSATATSSFTELGIPKEASKVLQSIGFDHAFAIQAALLPLLLPGNRRQRGDVLVSAATGSGKTLAYVLPMISDISRTSIVRLRGLIVVPTRDLIYQALKMCEIGVSAFAGRGGRKVKIGIATGDMPYHKELHRLMNRERLYFPAESRRRQHRGNTRWESSDHDTNGENSGHSENETGSTPAGHILKYTPKSDILICSPGRLVQHLHHTNGFELNHVNWLVIDEADKILNQSYQQWLQVVMTSLARGKERAVTKIILSATVGRVLGKLSELHLKSPKLVVLEGTGAVNTSSDTAAFESTSIAIIPDTYFTLPDTLKESTVHIPLRSEKPLHLLHILQRIIEEASEADVGSSAQRGALVFTSSNEAAVRLSRLLELLDPSIADAIATMTSTIPTSQRKKAIQDFQDRKLSILVASDLVSRGLDLPSLGYVINYDIPQSLETYIHRVGRTARAGREGHAITLYIEGSEDFQWGEIFNTRFVKRGEGKEINDIDSSPLKGGFQLIWYQKALSVLNREVGKNRKQKPKDHK